MSESVYFGAYKKSFLISGNIPEKYIPVLKSNGGNYFEALKGFVFTSDKFELAQKLFEYIQSDSDIPNNLNVLLNLKNPNDIKDKPIVSIEILQSQIHELKNMIQTQSEIINSLSKNVSDLCNKIAK